MPSFSLLSHKSHVYQVLGLFKNGITLYYQGLIPMYDSVWPLPFFCWKKHLLIEHKPLFGGYVIDMILSRHPPCMVCLPTFILSTEEGNAVHQIGMMTSPPVFPTAPNMQKLNTQRKKEETQVKWSPHYWLHQLCHILQKKNQGMRPMLVVCH